jgi:hypothetical protein
MDGESCRTYSHQMFAKASWNVGETLGGCKTALEREYISGQDQLG